MSVEARITELGLSLPEVPAPAGSYVPAVSAGKLVFASGQTATYDGEPIYPGRLGEEITLDQGQEASRVAALLCLAELKSVLGSLARIEQVVKLNGWVASTPDFTDQPRIVDGASQLLMDLFGEAGQHARAAIGVAALPGGACVELELCVEVA